MSYRLSSLAALLLAGVWSAQAQPRTCSLSSVPVTLRAESLSELVGDIVIACSGGVPVGLLYVPGVTDVLTGWSLATQSTGTGWLGLTLEEGGSTILTDTELRALTMDSSCGF